MTTAMIVAATGDKDLAKQLVDALSGGFNASLAPEPPDLCNMDMRAAAVSAIKSATAVIVVVTEAALKSPFVRFSAESARRFGVKLVPVLFQPIEAGALLTLTGGAEPVLLDPPPEEEMAEGQRPLGAVEARHAQEIAVLVATDHAPAAPKTARAAPAGAMGAREEAEEGSWADDQEVGDPAPAPAVDAPVVMRRASAADVHRPSADTFRAAKLFENAPRRMRVGRAQEITVRLSRDEAGGAGMTGAVSAHDVLAAGAMTVTLDDPSFGYAIRPLSPATQWVDRAALASVGLGLERQPAEWRWSVEPLKTGRRPLVIRASARVADASGVSAEAGLPEQTVEIRVGVDPARAAKDVARWLLFAMAAGVLGHYSVEIIQTVNAFIG